jgi:hypothetical protein
MNLKQDDIRQIIEQVKKENIADGRGRSFDYCYNYFRANSGNKLTKDIEKSCLVIGFYLASWGMLRSSSFLSKKSVKYFKPLITYFSTLDKEYWQYDVDKYNFLTIREICDLYQEIKNRIIERNAQPHTLVTKIMLGVFGIVPAFDNNFKAFLRHLSNSQYGLTSFNEKTLGFIHQFYLDNKTVINNLSDSTQTIDFKNGKQTGLKYTKARIIDMYGFIIGEQHQKDRVLKK